MGIKFVLSVTLLLASCVHQNDVAPDSDSPYVVDKVIYQDTFDRVDTSQWLVESEEEFLLSDNISNGSLDVNVSKGITIWHKVKFSGNLMFEFDVTVIKAGGKNDRVSDLNCFWMATDPQFPDNFFAQSSWRKGIFWNYYPLNLYYVGYGGHDNTKTRFRKYNGLSNPLPPVLQEHSDTSHLIIPNKKNTVAIISFDSTVAYYFNKKKIFEIKEKRPYREGYFGFRTLNNHMRIENFIVYTLRSSH
ncbi:MAG: DUF6250 domain-containing protein [Cyclobacteriaceae bacterium]